MYLFLILNNMRIKYNLPNHRVVIYLDHHCTRISETLMDAFTSNFIDAILLIAHSSTHSQSFDLSIFGVFKQTFKKRLVWINIETGSEEMRINVIGAFIRCMSICINELYCSKGFRHAGLYPQDATAPLKSTLIIDKEHSDEIMVEKRKKVKLTPGLYIYAGNLSNAQELEGLEVAEVVILDVENEDNEFNTEQFESEESEMEEG